MPQKAITIYTPTGAEPHIYAEDDAQMHRGLIGESGILICDGQLAATIVNNNSVRLASGMYSNQGYILCVRGGSSVDLPVDSGNAGTYRHDLIVAHFVRGGGDVSDSHVFEVVKGTEAALSADALDPTITQDNLITGGQERMEVLYRLIINGTEIASVVRVAPFVGNVYQ